MNAQVNENKLEQSISSDKAKNIKTLIRITGGQLNIKEGAKNLADVKINYDKNDWNPSVSYTEDQGVGKLTVKASTEGEEKRIDDDNICNIQLNKDYNYSLAVVLGAGVGNMNFDGFNIEKALLKLGIGSFNINLANTSIPFLKIEAGIGEATLNLSGEYKNDLKAQINAGIGEMKIFVPKNIGVKFEINGFLGDIDTPGYSKKGNEYTNDLFEKTKYSISVRIKGAIGSIKIKEI